jgi:hypothetical protein
MTPSHLLFAGLILFAGHLSGQSATTQTKSPATTQAAAVQIPTVQVPFVGCASDGQAGPQGAPTGQAQAVAISVSTAQRLAYYKAEYGIGILAPRGWHCFSTYGSNGSNLYVTPAPIDPKAPFSAGWKGFSGEAIEVSFSDGGTSGRFQVAQVIMRVFPAHKSFAQSVVAEGIEPANSFPSGPYPQDKLTYRGTSVVEFETSANAAGLGTNSELQVGPGPIDGVAIISGMDTDLTQLSARLSGSDSGLIHSIVGQVEREATAPQTP